jgi:N-acetylglucosaminyldiphosphoundecaprenol N-acetyl-beta-D-mannosaminyltransferase
MLQNYTLFNQQLVDINQSKVLINTLNAHSYNTLQKDESFSKALLDSDVLLPDGISVVWATRLLTGKKIQKIAGADLFKFEMERVNAIAGTCFFLGSSEETLQKIVKQADKEFPHVKVYTFSPPFKTEFSEADNNAMIEAVNAVKPDVLFIGMTAPKQEKWAYQQFQKLEVGHICCVGAVFDFYAGTVKRAPKWLIQIGMEWLYRLLIEPRRMWRRYLLGNLKFIILILIEKFVPKLSRVNT